MKKTMLIFCIIATFKISTAQTPVDFYYKRAIEKDSLDDYKGAIEDFTRAITFDSSNANYYNKRGLSKHFIEDYHSAIMDFTKALHFNPNNPEFYFQN